MVKRIIKASSKEGDLILDLFSGSGIVSLTALELKRNFIGCEMNKKYLNTKLKDFIYE